jgi:hypothetical protein
MESVRSRFSGSSSSVSSSMRSNRKGHHPRQLIALGHQQQLVELVVLVAGQLHLAGTVGVQARQRHLAGVAQDLGQAAVTAGQHAPAVAQVVVDLHVAQRREAVEPGVGHLVHGLLEAMPLDAGDEFVALAGHLGGPLAAVDQGHVAPHFGWHHAGGRDAQHVGALGHGLDEVQPRLGGVALEVGLVHVCPWKSVSGLVLLARFSWSAYWMRARWPAAMAAISSARSLAT